MLDPVIASNYAAHVNYAQRIQVIQQPDGWAWTLDGKLSTRRHPTRRAAWKAAKSAAKNTKLPEFDC